jgi:hypothetical protein
MAIILSPIFAETYSTPFPQTVYGYVDSQNDISITLDESAFPFDILSDSVAQNTDTNLVKGLRIGTISMASNDDSFTITISHDKLDNGGNKLDYRLDVFYGPGSNQFVSVTSQNEGKITKAMLNLPDNEQTYSIAERSIYLSMTDDKTTLQDDNTAPKGTYTSTITCTLKVGT